MNLRHPGGRPHVIGHRGAAAVAPENTLESLEAAVAAGADLVEFDVVAGLLLGHPGRDAHGAPATLDDALALLARKGVGAHVDLKLVGVEAEIVAAVRRHGLEERTVVSSTWAHSLRRLAHDAPGLTRAISYPRDRVGASNVRWPKPVVAASAACLRPAMRVRLVPLLGAARAGVLSLHHSLVSRTVVTAVHGRGAQLIAWTVNDAAEVERLTRLGVDAIVSDDPGMAVRVVATLHAA
jgi:glycerophosphoryl diester phosphodiesterase